jgi:hypothetical protein
MSGGGRLRRAAALFPGLLTAMLVLACSGSSPTTGPARVSTQQQGQPAAAPATAAPAPAATSGTGSGNGAAIPGQYIIRSGTLELEVNDVDSATSSARAQVQAAGGYVSASDESTKEDRHIATITYRVPVDRWQEVVTSLRGLAGKVIRENTQAEEVTAQVVDLGARIDNLRASETSIREIMTRAGSIDDVLSVQERLSSVQEEIERLVAQQQDLTGRAGLGTLAVTWENPPTVIPAVETVQSGWSLSREVDHALAQTVNAGQVLASFLVWLVIVGIPVLGPFVLLAVVIALFLRRYNKKHPRPAYVGWGPPAGPPAGPPVAPPGA